MKIDGIKDQSVVSGRAGIAISGLSQSNLHRLGKSDGEPGTQLPATNSDRQSQKVGLGNLSLNTPNEIVGDLFHDIYCCSKCVSMDESGIWSILTDTLHYVKPEIDSSVIFSYDQKRHQNSKSKYFDAAFSNIPNEMIIIQWITYMMQNKKTLMQQITMFLMFQSIHKHCSPSMRKIDYGNLSLFTTSIFRPHEKYFVQLICGQKKLPAVLWKVRHMIWKEITCGLSKVSFPINLQAESQGETYGWYKYQGNYFDRYWLFPKPILNKMFYDKHPYLHEMPHYSIQSIGVVVADDGVIKVTEAIQFMIKFHGHVFEFIAYLADMSDTFDFVIGQKSMYELEATVDYHNLAFTFLKRSLPVYAVENYTIKPGKSKDMVLELKEIPFEVHGYKDFSKRWE